MPPKYTKYTEGEKILCFHGPLIYEAKCLKTNVKGKIPKYLIHYAGWNKNWDEWVTEGRMLKYNDENLARQKQLQEELAPKSSKKSKPSKTDPAKDSTCSGPTNQAPAKRKGRKLSSTVASNQDSHSCAGPSTPAKRSRANSVTEPEVQPPVKVDLKVKIPDRLKDWLVDDQDLIGRQRKLVSLPANITVDHILDKFLDFFKSNNEDDVDRQEVIEEVVSGLKMFFNLMLGTQLLYKFERPQYADMLQTCAGKTMSQIYGASHFLRMFVQLDNMLTDLLPETDVEAMLEQISEILKYLDENKSTFFILSDYENSPPEYHRKAQ